MLRNKISFILFLINFNLIDNFASEKKIDPEFKLGLENISDELLKNVLLKKNHKKPGIGLVTNQTGIDQKGNRNIDILLSLGLNLKAIFAPEHGITGKVLAEKKITDVKDEITSLPIKSLYMGDSKFRKFEKKELDDIDIFVFDIQDSGMRHYTYISILFKMMQVCSEHNKILIVLDRPNPLGYLIEGPLVHPDLFSFVSIASIPLRHAMTIGELAKYFNKYFIKKHIDLIVVPMKNYKRTLGLKNKLPISLSPNIRNINSCHNYSFLGILGEIAPFSILAGTEHAFECLMVQNNKNHAKINWPELRKLLEKYNVLSYMFSFKKNDGKKYIGIKIKIKNINNFSSLRTIIAILKFFKKSGIKFYYSKAFNKVIGTYQFRHFIDESISHEKFYNKINKDLKDFYQKAKDLFIYSPLPRIVELG